MLDRILSNPSTLFWICVFSIPVTAILVGGITTITSHLIRHRERMAMIERGIHPDAVRPRETTRNT